MKRPTSPTNDQRSSKVPKPEGESDEFSREAILNFQKDAIWRQMQEYKESLKREGSRAEALQNQRDSLSVVLNSILKILSKNSGQDLESLFGKLNCSDVFSQISQFEPIIAQFVHGFEHGKFIPSKISQVLDEGRVAALMKSHEELTTEYSRLKEELSSKERKCLRYQSELAKFKTKVPGSGSPTEIVSTLDEPKSEATDDRHRVIIAELETQKKISEQRLQEISFLHHEIGNLRAGLAVADDQLRRLPPNYERDMISYDDLKYQYNNLRSEIDSRMSAYEELNRHIGDTNSRRSQFISSLENELALKRFAAKEFAEGLESDLNRLRKDRDHMRELYESSNMQVASLSKQNANLNLLNEQLSKKLELTDEKLLAIIKSSKDSNDAETLILGEIESIGEAFDVLQKQNSQLIKQIAEKDEALTRVSGEKLKAEFSLTQTQREADLVKQRASKVEHDALKAAERAESEAKRLSVLNEQLERNLLERGSESEKLKWKLVDITRHLTELKGKYDALASRTSEAAIAERVQLLEQAIFEKRRLEETLEVCQAKLNAYSSSPSGQSKDLQEELNIYKKLMKCNSCHIRDKTVVLTKCFHVFCKECIDTRIETRQRKCPNCAESFGVNDVKAIYL